MLVKVKQHVLLLLLLLLLYRLGRCVPLLLLLVLERAQPAA